MKTDLNVKLISMEDIMAAKCCDIQEVIRVIEEVLVDYKMVKLCFQIKFRKFLIWKRRIELTACHQH